MSNTTPAIVEQAQVRIRRAPKISVFLILGALVGFVGTLILTALQPVDPAVGFLALFGYFCIYGIPAGVVLGAIVAVVFDVRSSRRATIVPAERVAVDEPLNEPVDDAVNEPQELS